MASELSAAGVGDESTMMTHIFARGGRDCICHSTFPFVLDLRMRKSGDGIRQSVPMPVVARDKEKLKISRQSGGVIEEYFPFAADI